MLPLGEDAIISECRAAEATRKFLEGLGVIPGATISVLSEMHGNLIVCIKGSRLALNKELAQQLLVQA